MSPTVVSPMPDAVRQILGPLGALFPSQHVEAWKPAHAEAMACRDLDEAVANCLAFYTLIHGANQRWADAIDSGATSFSWSAAEQFAAAYRWWHQGATLLEQAIAESERRGFEVEHAQEFRDAIREVSLLPLDVDRVKSSIAALKNGKGIPFEQAMDELQDHLHD